MRKVFSSLVVFFTCMGAQCFCGTIAKAEFTKVGLSYVSDDLLVIVVPTSMPTPGIFVAQNLNTDHKFNIQDLRLDSLTREGIASVFLRYQDGRFTSAVIPNPSGSENGEVKIAGDFSLKVGSSATISVSSANTPWYLSITLYSPGRPPEILGFLGLREIARTFGIERVTYLQANQFSSTSVLTPYLLAFDRILLNDKPISGNRIGVPLADDSNNPCFQENSHILDEETVEQYQAADLKGKLKILRQSDAKNNIVDFVTLSSNAKVKTVFDMADNRFGVLRFLEKGAQRTICTFTPVNID